MGETEEELKVRLFKGRPNNLNERTKTMRDGELPTGVAVDEKWGGRGDLVWIRKWKSNELKLSSWCLV